MRVPTNTKLDRQSNEIQRIIDQNLFKRGLFYEKSIVCVILYINFFVFLRKKLFF